MKKRGLILSALILMFGLAAGSVFAMFMARGSVSGITFTTTNPSLTLNGQSEWNADVSFDNIAPGWQSENPIVMTLRNETPDHNPMQISLLANAESSSEELPQNLLMKVIYTAPGGEPIEETIEWWTQNETVFSDQLLTDDEQDLYLWFSLPADAGEELQNTSLDLDLVLNGTLVSN